MTVNLRPPQKKLCDEVFDSWGADDVVCGVAPTGFGKTQVISYMTEQAEGGVCVLAHRQELIGQVSRTLAQRGIRHRIIAADKTVRQIIESHVLRFGKSFHDPMSRVAAASVQTIVNRGNELAKFLPVVKLWIGDEGHHYLKGNIWGKAIDMMVNPDCKGLLLTATPTRTDGQGLGSHHDGLADSLVLGPSLRQTIRDGYLVDYKIYAPPSSFHREDIRKGANGEFVKSEATEAVAHSSLVDPDKKQIVGDIVRHYLKFAPGKLGITFVPSIEVGERVAEQYKQSGVPASVISAKTNDIDRVRIMQKFERRQIMQLVSVDLIGEGVDVPNVEVISMARPTESFSLFAQQCGRPLRLNISGDLHRIWGDLTREQRLQHIADSEKPSAIIIDHVGNVKKHATVRDDGYGMVIDVCHKEWTLDRRDKKAKNESGDSIPTRTCLNPDCFAMFERFRKCCPFCGVPVPPPTVRGTPEEVDGDLTELDPGALAEMQGEIDSVFDELESHESATSRYQLGLEAKRTPRPWLVKNVRQFSLKYDQKLKDHDSRQAMQPTLREMMAQWAGYRRHLDNLSDSEIFKLFYFKFGIDWQKAQCLYADEAGELIGRIAEDY